MAGSRLRSLRKNLIQCPESVDHYTNNGVKTVHKPVMNPALEGVVRAVPEVCNENAAKRTIPANTALTQSRGFRCRNERIENGRSARAAKVNIHAFSVDGAMIANVSCLATKLQPQTAVTSKSAIDHRVRYGIAVPKEDIYTECLTKNVMSAVPRETYDNLVRKHWQP